MYFGRFCGQSVSDIWLLFSRTSLVKYFGHYTPFFSFSGMLNLMFICYVLLSCFTKMVTVFGSDLHSCQFFNNSDLQCLCSLCRNVRFLPLDQLRICTLLLRKKRRRRPHILQNGMSLLNIAQCKMFYYFYLLLANTFMCTCNRVQVMAPY